MSSPIRLIALDLDGTVLDDRKCLTPRTQRALTAAGQQGVWIVPATGRTLTGLPAELMALPGVRYVITANGAQVQDIAGPDGPRTLRRLYIPRDKALAAFDALARYDCVTDIFQDGQGYTTAKNAALTETFVPENLREYILTTRIQLPDLREFIAAQPDGIEKLTLFFLSDEERARAWAEMEALGLTVVSSLPRNMELNAAGVNKGAGLLALAEELNLPVQALMACGDGGNDLEMVRAAGLGVAMANAFPEVKAAARWVTASNNEDGVALAVERFVLNGEPLP